MAKRWPTVPQASVVLPIKLTMIYFRALVVLATTFSALASPLMQRTVAQVEADINAIGTQVVSITFLTDPLLLNGIVDNFKQRDYCLP